MRSPRLLQAVLARCASRRYASWQGTELQYRGTYNDLPVPSGSWKTQYEANQKKYNMHLMAGVTSLVVAVITLKATGCLYLNATVPDRPVEKNDYYCITPKK